MRGGVLLAVLFCLPATGAFAAVAALLCHPDPPGTKTAQVNGQVKQYAMSGAGVSIVYRSRRACLRTRWQVGRPLSAARRVNGAACADRLSAPRTESVAYRARARVSLIPGSADLPGRVRVRASSGTVRRWPLPVDVAKLDAFGQTAVFAAADGGAYAMRLSDGHVALIGPDRRGDTPQIEAPGVVFQDNLDKAKEHSGRTLMKFIPSAAVDQALWEAGRPVDLPGTIEAIGMDGFRVALAVHRQGECARIMYWNIAWDYLSKITDEDERTCQLTRSGGVIRSVAIAGIRSAWTIRSRRADRILTSNSTACFDRIVATVPRKDRGVTSLSGDAPALAYAISSGVEGGNIIGTVGARRVRPLVRGGKAPIAVSADAGKVAVANGDGTIDLRLAGGELVGTVQEPDAAAMALRADRLVALTRSGRLHVFVATTQEKLRDWPIPAGVSPRVDMQFGVAVLTAGRKVFAVSLKTGRRAVIATAPSAAHAEIEPPGVAYSYNSGSGGHLRFIRFAEVEAALR
jgi:hypothetical protein